MIRRAAVLLTLCGAFAMPAWPGPARAEQVCALPEVLTAVDTELRRRGIGGTLDTRSVGEVTGPDAASASCSVRLVQRFYDTNVAGLRPVDRVEVRGYRVTQLRNGLLVSLAE